MVWIGHPVSSSIAFHLWDCSCLLLNLDKVSLFLIISRTNDWCLEQEPPRLNWPNSSRCMERYSDLSTCPTRFLVQTNTCTFGFVLYSFTESTAAKVQKQDLFVSLCSPARVWSSMPSRSLLRPSRLCRVRWLRTLVWREVSSSLNCTLHTTRETRTWALTLRYAGVPDNIFVEKNPVYVCPISNPECVAVLCHQPIVFAFGSDGWLRWCDAVIRQRDLLWRTCLNAAFWSLISSNTGASNWPPMLPSQYWGLTRWVHKHKHKILLEHRSAKQATTKGDIFSLHLLIHTHVRGIFQLCFFKLPCPIYGALLTSVLINMVIVVEHVH